MIATAQFLPRLVLLAGVLSALAACGGGMIRDWPWSPVNGGAGRAGAPPAAGTTDTIAEPAVRGRAIALRVRDESERETVRLTALANEVLSQRGFRPDSTASAVLVLRVDRPRNLTAPGRPPIGIYGRGGSSGDTNLGLSIELPLGRGRVEPPQGRHEIIAELETGAGKVVWNERAATDAPVAPEIDARVARELLGRIVEKLAREDARQQHGGR